MSDDQWGPGDPNKWTRAACDAIVAWLDKKAAPPEQPGGAA